MSETTLPKRQAVDQQLTWDLTPIFSDDFAYTEAVKPVSYTHLTLPTICSV